MTNKERYKKIRELMDKIHELAEGSLDEIQIICFANFGKFCKKTIKTLPPFQLYVAKILEIRTNDNISRNHL